MKALLVPIALIFPLNGNALEVYGIEFPDGIRSFADRVVEYTPGENVSSPYTNSVNIKGVPDYVSGGDPEYLSLGDEGEVIVQFTNNALTSSGDDSNDLWIFEIGSKLEPTDVYISKYGIDWVSVGSTSGGTGGIDIDAFVNNGVELGASYSFVKIVDQLPTQSGSPWAGADIDAVGAISSVEGGCGNQEELAPATYDKNTGMLSIPSVLVDGKCYELELNGSSGLNIYENETYLRSSLSEK
ncbi:hypothetical protein ACJJIL_12595 [Microbulbifer sp. EKSA005]|uniref:hypothetical protein n=1 Tax=Microbulbifer sp. EKSA005 TaxID=3243364 RepID=UPI004041F8A3